MFVVPDDLIGRAGVEFRHLGHSVLNLAGSFEKFPALAVGYAVKPFLHRDLKGDVFGLARGSREFLHRLIEFGIVNLDSHMSDCTLTLPRIPVELACGRGFFDLVAFAGGEEEVGFEAVLAGVEVVVAAA